MHKELALEYEKRWLARFGLTYYGCCEALHAKAEILSTVPNLRKVSLSPFADLDAAMENWDPRYVLSFKPNPVFLAGESAAPEASRRELENAVRLAKSNGRSMEIVLKTMISIHDDPRRLWDWDVIARRAVEAF